MLCGIAKQLKKKIYLGLIVFNSIFFVYFLFV